MTVFLIVAAAAPELRSDAIRIYWPYVKLMKHSQGFFDLPFHFSYIIPQAGLSYAASVFLLLRIESCPLGYVVALAGAGRHRGEPVQSCQWG